MENKPTQDIKNIQVYVIVINGERKSHFDIVKKIFDIVRTLVIIAYTLAKTLPFLQIG